MLRKTLIVCASFFAAWAVTAPFNLSAEETQASWGPKSTPNLVAAPQRLVEISGVEPAFVLAAADEAMVRPITAWNLAGNLPLRNGIERSLPKALLVVLPKKEPGTKLEYFGSGVLARSAEDDATVWGIAIRTEQAWRIRIRLGDVRLPRDAKIWVYGENEEVVGPFGTELRSPDGTLWTPSVGGAEIRLEVSVPDAAWDFERTPSLKVLAVSELFPLDDAGQLQFRGELQSKETSCLVDAACVGTGDWSPVDIVKKAVAFLQYQDGGNSYMCTGGLVNDKVQGTWVPYLLTANHCFSTQSAASTLEAFFDYIDSTCGGTAPPLATLPRSNGSTLLETSATNDFTFVRLNQSPGGRGFLGWTTTEPANGAILHRVSHPMGWAAGYSSSTKTTSPSDTCGWSTTNFHFSEPQIGGVFGGSSGGAFLNDSGQIVGQLKGQCGPTDPGDGCDYSNYQADGKFSVTFPWISQYINDDGGGGGSCVQDLDGGVVCLRNGRFEFIATWTDFANPPVTRPLIWTPVEDINATGGFQNNPSGIQIVMRVADGCRQTGTWWVWLGGFTDAGWDIRVRDTVTGKQRTFIKARQGGVFPTTLRDSTTFTCN
jgi:hypothetical protein